jgi:Ca2+-binding RTX toxin-like protein
MNDLIITYDGPSDEQDVLIVRGYYGANSNDNPSYLVENIKYSNNVSLSLPTVVTGTTGNDTYAPGGNSNYLYDGNGGTDTVTTGSGSDVIWGGNGNDVIDTGAGDDVIYGGAHLTGGTGNDVLYGGGGGDNYYFVTGDGHDTIIELSAAVAADRINFSNDVSIDINSISFLGTGNDLKVYYTGSDTITVKDQFLSEDNRVEVVFFNVSTTMQIGHSSYTWVVADTDSGDDIDGTSGQDWILGGLGADTIDAGVGYDKIYGGAGNDTINGQEGNDDIWGGAGNDIIDGGAGLDDIYGGDGDDVIYGGNEKNSSDILYGDDGADTFLFKAESWYPDANDHDRIKDFNESDGDAIDISDILSGYYEDGVDDILVFVSITNDGTHSTLKIDLDGPGGVGFKSTALIENVIGLDVEDMVTAGSLVVA